MYEIFLITPEIRHLVVEEASEDALKALAIQQGMKTLKMQALEQVRKGHTTLEEVLRVIDMRES